MRQPSKGTPHDNGNSACPGRHKQFVQRLQKNRHCVELTLTIKQWNTPLVPCLLRFLAQVYRTGKEVPAAPWDSERQSTTWRHKTTHPMYNTTHVAFLFPGLSFFFSPPEDDSKKCVTGAIQSKKKHHFVLYSFATTPLSTHSVHRTQLKCPWGKVFSLLLLLRNRKPIIM